jgi:hypothetical protein
MPMGPLVGKLLLQGRYRAAIDAIILGGNMATAFIESNSHGSGSGNGSGNSGGGDNNTAVTSNANNRNGDPDSNRSNSKLSAKVETASATVSSLSSTKVTQSMYKARQLYVAGANASDVLAAMPRYKFVAYVYNITLMLPFPYACDKESPSPLPPLCVALISHYIFQNISEFI